jgi:ABC-2 type transport system permease protein
VSGFWPIFKRDLFAIFVTPMAWALIVIFLLLEGLNFYWLTVHFANQVDLAVDHGPLQWFFGETILFYLPLLMLPPALTMRSFAEERRAGTIESLLTAPVSTPGVVLAKWCAALATYLVAWAPTLLYIVILRRAGDVDWRVVGSSYLGVVLIGASFLSIGVLMSAMSKSQFVAVLLSLAVTVGLFILGIGEFIFDRGLAHDICSHISIWSQMADFSKGQIDSRHLVFHLSLTILPLFICVRVVDSWRWG